MKRDPVDEPDPRRPICLPGLSDTVSCTECTGLIPSLPVDREELAAYQQLSDLEIPPEESLRPDDNRPVKR